MWLVYHETYSEQIAFKYWPGIHTNDCSHIIQIDLWKWLPLQLSNVERTLKWFSFYRIPFTWAKGRQWSRYNHSNWNCFVGHIICNYRKSWGQLLSSHQLRIVVKAKDTWRTFLMMIFFELTAYKANKMDIKKGSLEHLRAD